MSKVRVGINGFGRIGRMVFREGFDDLDIVGINCLMTPEQTAHLLKWDSVHGKYKYDVEATDNGIVVNGKSIKLYRDRNPENIPWKDWGVDLALECTGAFKKKEDFDKHIRAGAKKVMVSAPSPGADFTVVYGVNEKEIDKDKHNILSNASCTTNCLAPLVKVLHEKLGVEQGLMTTIHSYTNDQRILDSPHSDLRRARAAAENMIPTTTGAAKTVGKILPELEGKIDGFSVRVPTPNVSLVDFTFTSKKATDIKAVNKILEDAANGDYKGIIEFEKEPLVSRDFLGRTASSMVDAQSTMVMGSNMVKVVSWYDNEAGFSKRMVDLAKYWLG
jgi:glyceraldehyde 3-phosphate dehydrogenase